MRPLVSDDLSLAEIAEMTRKYFAAVARFARKFMYRVAALFIGAVVALAFVAPIATARAATFKRIVVLAPNLAEMTFAAGAGQYLVGAVEYSDFPAQARAIPRIGDAFHVDIERLFALQPDIVLAWETGTSQATIEQLQHHGFNVKLIRTRRLADIPMSLRAIGQLAGTSAIADARAREFEQEIARLRTTYGARPQIRVFIEVDDRPLYTVNREQIISEMVELCGGKNIFSSLTQLAPVIGVEAVIAEDPEVILSTDDTVADARSEWAKWSRMTAVRAQNIFTMPSDLVTRSTLRTPEGMGVICEALDRARERLSRLAK